MENFPNWKYNLPNLCSFEALSLEKVHNYFGFLLAYSYLCNRQKSINNAESAQNRRKCVFEECRRCLNKRILKEIEWQIPVLKVLGLNPNGITHRKHRETPINKGFLDVSYKEIRVPFLVLVWLTRIIENFSQLLDFTDY